MNKVKKAIIVEDERIIALDLENTLENMGFTITNIVSSGEAILGLLSNMIELPDIIFMDIGLIGKLDGIETAKQINDLYVIPIIFLTAFEDQKTIQRANLTKHYGYIIKPFEDSQVEEVVLKLFNKNN